MENEKKKKDYGRTGLNVQDTVDDILDLDPFERWILGKDNKKKETACSDISAGR